MHRINLRGPWQAARDERAGYRLLRNFHAPPKLDLGRERVWLSLLLTSGSLQPRVQLNGADAPVRFDAPPGDQGGVLGRCDISTILAAYNSLALCWSGAEAAEVSLPLGELKLSPTSSHPLLLDVWLEIEER